MQPMVLGKLSKSMERCQNLAQSMRLKHPVLWGKEGKIMESEGKVKKNKEKLGFKSRELSQEF